MVHWTFFLFNEKTKQAIQFILKQFTTFSTTNLTILTSEIFQKLRDFYWTHFQSLQYLKNPFFI